MLPRQPLRFLLADDPGAGKTIMASLLIKELIARGEGTGPVPRLITTEFAVYLERLVNATKAA